MKRIIALAAIPITLGIALMFDNIVRSLRLATAKDLAAAPQSINGQITLELAFAAVILALVWVALVYAEREFLVPAAYILVAGVILMYILGMSVPLFTPFRELVRNNGNLLAPIGYYSFTAFAVQATAFLFVIGIAGLARTIYARQVPRLQHQLA